MNKRTTSMHSSHDLQIRREIAQSSQDASREAFKSWLRKRASACRAHLNRQADEILSATEFKNFATVYPKLFNVFANAHYPRAGRRNREELRQTLLASAGVEWKRKPFCRLPLDEIVSICRAAGYGKILHLPKKMADWVRTNDWQEDLAKLVPFNDVLIDVKGNRHNSVRELAFANLLHASNKVVQFNHAYGDGTGRTMDLYFPSANVGGEIWGLGKGRSNTTAAWEARTRTYEEKKESKIANPPAGVPMIYLNGVDQGQAIPVLQFLLTGSKFVWERLYPGEQPPIVTSAEALVWSRSSVTPQKLALMISEAKSGVDAALAGFGMTPPMVDRLFGLIEDGETVSNAARRVGISEDIFVGISRVRAQRSWQVRLHAVEGAQGRFPDLYRDEGAPYMSFLKAWGFLCGLRESQRLRNAQLPDWVVEMAAAAPRTKCGVLGVSFRGGPHACWVVTANRILRRKIGHSFTTRSIGRRGAFAGTRQFLEELLARTDGFLLVCESVAGAALIRSGVRTRPPIYVIEKPSRSDLDEVVRMMIRRLALIKTRSGVGSSANCGSAVGQSSAQRAQ